MCQMLYEHSLSHTLLTVNTFNDKECVGKALTVKTLLKCVNKDIICRVSFSVDNHDFLPVLFGVDTDALGLIVVPVPVIPLDKMAAISQTTSLTHLGRDKMAAISQTTFPNAFPWMKMYEFRIRFHWILFPGVQLTIFQHWFRQWFGARQATSQYLNQGWFVNWRIYASFGLNELSAFSFMKSFVFWVKFH